MMVSEFLRLKMEVAGLKTLAEVSRLTGLHPNTLASLRNHDAGITERTAAKLASAGLGTNGEWMACEAYRKANPSKNFLKYAQKVRVRATSRRKFAIEPCGMCGSENGAERHHENYEQFDVKFLCRRCHAADHHADGTWGQGGRKEAVCVICGKIFQYAQKKASKTCSKQCLSARCRQLIIERWQKGFL